MLVGSLFLFGGILGFVPGVIKDGMYFGIFMVNTPHNILHIASGTIFLIASTFGSRPARLWFQIFGTAFAWTSKNSVFIQLGPPTSCSSNLMSYPYFIRSLTDPCREKFAGDILISDAWVLAWLDRGHFEGRYRSTCRM